MNERTWGWSRVLVGLFNLSIMALFFRLVYLTNSYWMGIIEILWLLCFFMIASFSAIILAGDGLIMLARVRKNEAC